MLKLRYETLQTQSHSRTTPSYVLECYKAAFGAVSGAPLPATRAGGYLHNLDVLQTINIRNCETIRSANPKFPATSVSEYRS